MTPEETHRQHIRDLDDVLEETEGCIERVRTKRFSRTTKQKAYREVNHVCPVDAFGELGSA